MHIYIYIYIHIHIHIKLDLSGGQVVKTQSSNARDMGPIPIRELRKPHSLQHSQKIKKEMEKKT